MRICLVGVKMNKYEELKQQLDLEWQKHPRNCAVIELLHAQYIHECDKFEEKVFMECKLPRHELMLKRANFG